VVGLQPSPLPPPQPTPTLPVPGRPLPPSPVEPTQEQPSFDDALGSGGQQAFPPPAMMKCDVQETATLRFVSSAGSDANETRGRGGLGHPARQPRPRQLRSIACERHPLEQCAREPGRARDRRAGRAGSVDRAVFTRLVRGWRELRVHAEPAPEGGAVRANAAPLGAPPLTSRSEPSRRRSPLTSFHVHSRLYR
jgi:hypothetical protein